MDLVKLVRWEYDVETDMFTFDDQFYALYGTTAEREGGPLMSSQDYARKFIPAEEASIVAEEVSKALATTDPNFTSQVEHRIIRADGTEGVIAVRFGIIKDSEGRTIRTYGANQDITDRKRTEDALRESKQRLANIIDFLPDATFAVDREGKVIAWNRAVEEMTGISKDDMLDRSGYAYAVPFYGEARPILIDLVNQHQKEIESKYSNILRKGDQIIAENTTPMLNQGKGATLWGIASPLYDSSGSIVGAIESVRDITDRKREQEELQNNLRFLETMINTIPSPIFFKDRQGRYLGCNDTFARQIVGLPKESIIGKSVYELPETIPSDLADRYYEQDQELSREPGIQVYETQAQCADEVRRDFLFSKTPFNNFAGEVAGIVGVMLDITERRRSEKALRASHQILDGIINAIPVRVFWKDRDLVYFGCNAIFAHDAGFADPKDIVGKDDYQMGWRDQAELYRGDDRQVIESGRPKLLIEEPQTTPEGNTIVLLTSKIPLRSSEGEIIGVLGTYMDITERKRMESELRRSRDELELRVKERTGELARKNSEMERFIYTVSHDLRTPLISMSGFLGFLKQDAEKGDMKRLDADLQIVSDAVTKMDRLILDTLELSRIGRIISPPEDVPFGEIVSEALAQSSAKMSSKNVKVTVEEDLPIVQVDRMRLVEVLVNLFENSVKYMGDQPQPEIAIGKRLDGENTVFFVRDNGIGIEPSQHDKVFGLFYKVDKKSKGSGAGLAIAKRIIEVHRGRIWIESELGKGCTVCFTIPHVQDVFDTLNNGNNNHCGVNMKSKEQ
jgi:PAS domain S-box-containing protein